MPEGHTDTPQVNNTPQLLAEYIQYKHISKEMYMTQPCAQRAHRHPPNEQHSTVVGRIYSSWGVSVCPLGTGLGDEHFLRYVFVLDKFCQHLWGVVHLGGVCFLDMCLYWMYSAKNCGVLFSWGVSVCPSGTGLGHVQQKGPHNCFFW